MQYFDIAENDAVDIMHDILEGVGQYEAKQLFMYLTENCISKESLLNRLYAFDYGWKRKTNQQILTLTMDTLYLLWRIGAVFLNPSDVQSDPN